MRKKIPNLVAKPLPTYFRFFPGYASSLNQCLQNCKIAQTPPQLVVLYCHKRLIYHSDFLSPALNFIDNKFSFTHQINI